MSVPKKVEVKKNIDKLKNKKVDGKKVKGGGFKINGDPNDRSSGNGYSGGGG